MADLYQGRYRIHGEIGAGRNGRVFRATDCESDTSVALKIFSPESVPGKKSLALLEAELQRRAALDHPSIVRILNVGCHGGENSRPTIYVALEHIKGETLAQRVERLAKEPLSLRAILRLLSQTAEALGYLHAHGIAITNLDPKGILLSEDGRIKLPEFGYVTARQWIADASRLGSTSGIDYRYIAPEMLHEAGPQAGDERTDVYLFGILAFELGCGTVPFDANRHTIVHLHRSEPLPNSLRLSGLPAWYDELVRRCMAKEPAKRPSVAELSRVLSERLAEVETGADLTPQYINRSDISVLFVEDNKLDQLSLARSAKREPYPFSYKIAHSVGKAKEFLEVRRFDVVVCDFMLPDGTAVDVIKAASGTPTVVLTGAGKEEVVASSLRAGAFDYIAKHSNQQHLKEIPAAVQRAYEFGRARHASEVRSSGAEMLSLEREQVFERLSETVVMLFAQLRDARRSLNDERQLTECLDNLEAIANRFQAFLESAAVPAVDAAQKNENASGLVAETGARLAREKEGWHQC